MSTRTTTGTDAMMFFLPQGYCPTGGIADFPAYGDGGTAAGVAVAPPTARSSFVAGTTTFIGLGRSASGPDDGRPVTW